MAIDKRTDITNKEINTPIVKNTPIKAIKQEIGISVLGKLIGRCAFSARINVEIKII